LFIAVGLIYTFGSPCYL